MITPKLTRNKDGRVINLVKKIKTVEDVEILNNAESHITYTPSYVLCGLFGRNFNTRDEPFCFIFV